MAGNSSEGLGDDFFEQILAVPSAAYGRPERDVGGSRGSVGFGIGMGMPPLGLNLEAGFLRNHHDSVANNTPHLHHTTTSSSSSERDPVHMTGLFSAFGVGHLHAQAVRPTPLHSHRQPPIPVSTAGAVPQAPGIRPRVRARRGQATDPHSIAERLRRERIAERMRALQELVPTANKTDRAAMLDEIVDYVKFLRLQVKVLSMSRLGGAGAVAQLVADVPLSAVEVQSEGIEGERNEQAWEKWSNDGTEQQVAKLMEEDVGAAMQFLQSKALCLMPISLASAIFPTPQSDIKPESNTHP